jgi:hypothetical protein
MNLNTWTTQKTQPVCCWEGMFMALLHNNGSYSVVAFVFVATGMCLLSHCVPMDVSWFHCSGFHVSCHNTIGLIEKVVVSALKNLSNSHLGLQKSFLHLPSYKIGFEVLTAPTMRICSLVLCLILVYAGCFLGLLFNPEYGSTIFLQNAGELL